MVRAAHASARRLWREFRVELAADFRHPPHNLNDADAQQAALEAIDDILAREEKTMAEPWLTLHTHTFHHIRIRLHS